MKKLILLLVIAISMIACSGETIISSDEFVNDLNSFDSTATYNATISNFDSFGFVISYHDSLFSYNVEKSSTAAAIYTAKNPGDKVK